MTYKIPSFQVVLDLRAKREEEARLKREEEERRRLEEEEKRREEERRKKEKEDEVIDGAVKIFVESTMAGTVPDLRLTYKGATAVRDRLLAAGWPVRMIVLERGVGFFDGRNDFRFTPDTYTIALAG